MPVEHAEEDRRERLQRSRALDEGVEMRRTDVGSGILECVRTSTGTDERRVAGRLETLAGHIADEDADQIGVDLEDVVEVATDVRAGRSRPVQVREPHSRNRLRRR